MPMQNKRVIIVGAGFGGLNAAKKLAQESSLDIFILDRNNYHLFQPLLYQVAMAGLSPGEIASPIRTILSRFQNVRCLMTEVTGVKLADNKVITDIGELSYDYLILACGAQHSYFGHEEWETFAPGLKTLEQATEVRRRVLLAFEMAEREPDPVKIKRLLTFVVVGGGPTGVELAGALGEISRFALSRDFRHIDPRGTRILLIQAGPRILPSFVESLSQKATRDLEKLGVTVLTSTSVTNINGEGVTLGTETIEAATVLWAAGVKPSDLNTGLGTKLDQVGRVVVQKDLSIEGYPNAFVIGDQARFDENGKPLPGLAAVAIQQGRWVARNIFLDLKSQPRQSFHYWDKGQMATIGRSRAIVQTDHFRFDGWFAWYTWLLVHIYYLVGFHNRIFVLIQWAWSYFTFRRGARLIVNKEWRSFPARKHSIVL